MPVKLSFDPCNLKVKGEKGCISITEFKQQYHIEKETWTGKTLTIKSEPRILYGNYGYSVWYSVFIDLLKWIVFVCEMCLSALHIEIQVYVPPDFSS